MGLGVDEKLLANFAESFQRFNVNIQTVNVRSGRYSKHSIHACVLPLKEAAVASLKKSTWFHPKQTVVYGIGGAKEAICFVDFGINALLQSGSKSCVRAAVDATQPLIRRGIGKCARVPIATLVRINAEGRVLTGITRNVGYGGMALTLTRNAELPEIVVLRFVLPNAGAFSLTASPRRYSGRLIGVQFRPPLQEERLKRWVDEYSLLGVAGA